MADRVPVWRKAVPVRRSLGGFIRKHNKLFVVIGALIVFVTFVIKEGIRDSLREYATAYEIAEENLRTQRRVAAMELVLHRIEAQMTLTMDHVFGVDIHKGRSTVLIQRNDILGTRLNALTELSHSMHGLLDKFDFDRRAESANKMIALLERGKVEQLRLRDLAAHPPADASAQLDDIEMKTAQLEKETYEAGEEMLKNEGRQKEFLSDAADTYGVLAYVFYVLGWGLGLVASLCGVEGPRKSN